MAEAEHLTFSYTTTENDEAQSFADSDLLSVETQRPKLLNVTLTLQTASISTSSGVHAVRVPTDK